MDKRYQVFVSSTYADLKEERSRVIQALMEMDCIPAGMELFPAMDEEQWHFIKRVIDDCDYYLVIVGGRYGTLTPEGVSYTEKECEYALARNLKVTAFLHDNPDEIPLGKSEKSDEARAKLQAFREKLKTGRLVRMWNKAEQLPGLVALSLQKTIRTYPAVGWVRADQMPTAQLLSETNELRKHNQTLQAELSLLKATTSIPDLASLDDVVELNGTGLLPDATASYYRWKASLSWGEVFGRIAVFLMEHPNDEAVFERLKLVLPEEKLRNVGWSSEQFENVKVQLLALGLIRIDWQQSVGAGMQLYWSLTPKGEQTLLAVRAARKSAKDEDEVSGRS